MKIEFVIDMMLTVNTIFKNEKRIHYMLGVWYKFGRDGNILINGWIHKRYIKTDRLMAKIREREREVFILYLQPRVREMR